MKQNYYSDRQKNFMLEIGKICALFRKNFIRITLKELSNKSNVPISTLSSFEHGKSSNMKLMYVYINACENEKQENYLLKIIVATIKATKVVY